MTIREAAQQALEALEGGADSWQLVGPAIDALKAALAEPMQEPVAWRFQSAVGGWAYGSEPPLGSKYPAYPLYTAPPQRKPLTDEEIKRIDDSTHFHESPDWSLRFARAIERAHGIGEKE